MNNISHISMSEWLFKVLIEWLQMQSLVTSDFNYALFDLHWVNFSHLIILTTISYCNTERENGSYGSSNYKHMKCWCLSSTSLFYASFFFCTSHRHCTQLFSLTSTLWLTDTQCSLQKNRFFIACRLIYGQNNPKAVGIIKLRKVPRCNDVNSSSSERITQP